MQDAKDADIILKNIALDIDKSDDETFIVKTNKNTFISKSIIIATGGISYPVLGVSDFGYKIAKKFGHKIVPVRPALCAIATKMFPPELSGISFEAEASIGKEKIKDSILITHFGLGGPAIYRATVRNIVDGLTGEDVVTKGFTEKDQYGNQITQAKVNYTAEDKAMLTENGIVTVDNVDAVIEDTLDSGIKQTNAAKKKILWTVYSSTDNFLNQSFVPTVQRYAPFYNYDITFIYGDGTAEGSITDKFVNLSNYDAYVINMVETGSGSLYQNLLDQAA